MLNCFLAIASAVFLLIVPFQPNLAEVASPQPEANSINVDLPSVLDDDFFEDLPFEQRRQALRDEVELGPKRPPSTSNPKKYNLLIR